MDKKSMKSKVFSGLIWTFGERILAQSVSFLVSVLLARMILPEEYGIISIVLIFINIANVFVSNGFGESLIQRKEANDTDFSTVFYCSFTFSWLIYAVLFFLAPAISEFFHNEKLTLVLRVISLRIPISSINTVQHAYVSKHMVFKKFFFSTLGGTIVSGVIGIVMAYAGLGIWALVAQYLSNTLIDTIVLFFIVPWHPQMLFSKDSAASLISYSWKLTASSLVNQVYIELQSLIIGRKYSSADLAYYHKGNQFPSLIINNIDTSIGKVFFPAMAQYGDDHENLKRLSRRAVKTTSFIIFPMMVGLAAVAEPLVRLMLTENWIEAVPFLQIACIFYMCQPMQSTAWQIIKAVGRSDLCLKLELLKKVIGIGILTISMNHGTLAIAAGFATFGMISMVINQYPVQNLIGYRFSEQMRDILPAAALSVTMGAVTYLISMFALPDLLLIIIQVLSGVLVYVGLSSFFKMESFLFCVDILKKLMGK